jgi:hypothetical protein
MRAVPMFEGPCFTRSGEKVIVFGGSHRLLKSSVTTDITSTIVGPAADGAQNEAER